MYSEEYAIARQILALNSRFIRHNRMTGGDAEEDYQAQRTASKNTTKQEEMEQIRDYYNDRIQEDNDEFADFSQDINEQRQEVEEQTKQQIEDAQQEIKTDKEASKKAQEEYDKQIEDVDKTTEQKLKDIQAVRSLKGYKPCGDEGHDDAEEHEDMIEEEVEEEAQEDEDAEPADPNTMSAGAKKIRRMKRAIKIVKNKMEGGLLPQLLQLTFMLLTLGITAGVNNARQRQADEEDERDMKAAEEEDTRNQVIYNMQEMADNQALEAQLTALINEDIQDEQRFQNEINQMNAQAATEDAAEQTEFDQQRVAFENSLADETAADRAEILNYLDQQRAAFVANRQSLRDKQEQQMRDMREDLTKYVIKKSEESQNTVTKLATDYQKEKQEEQDKKEELDRRVDENLKKKGITKEQNEANIAKLKNAKQCQVTSQSNSKMRHDAIQEEKAKIAEEEDKKSKGITPASGGSKKYNRTDIVKRIMKTKGLNMIEASKYVKQHKLY